MFKKQKGFSLVEVVIAITILGVIGAYVGSILTTAFKGSNKSALLGDIKQNGQTALGLMDRTIRNSDKVICPYVTTQNSNYLIISTSDGKIVRFTISPQPSTYFNGTIIGDFPDVDTLLLNPADICITLVNTPPQNPTNLTDDNFNSGVSVRNGGFTVSKNPGFKDVVTVQFDLGPAVGKPVGYDASIGGSGYVHFVTSIQLR